MENDKFQSADIFHYSLLAAVVKGKHARYDDVPSLDAG